MPKDFEDLMVEEFATNDLRIFKISIFTMWKMYRTYE